MQDTNQLEFTAGAIDAFEVRTSRSLGGESGEIHFTVDGTANEGEAAETAEAALVDWDLLSFDGKPLTSVSIKPEYVNPDSEDDPGRWNVTVQYSRRAFTAPAMVKPENQSHFQAIDFDISGERRHITHSLKTELQCVPSGKTVVPFHGAIRVKSNGKHPVVEGTDIVVAHESFSLAKTVPTDQLTPGVRTQLKKMVGKTNLNPFTITLNGQADTYAMGELRFLGATGKIVEGLDRTDIVFRFEDNYTMFDVKVGDINVPRIGGFELLWVAYETTETAETLTVTPRQANVERVCDYIDFDILVSLGVT